jgi:hypothetical protein
MISSIAESLMVDLITETCLTTPLLIRPNLWQRGGHKIRYWHGEIFEFA